MVDWVVKKPPRRPPTKHPAPRERDRVMCDGNRGCSVVRLVGGASLMKAALHRDAQLLGGDVPALRADQAGGKELVDQSGHGPTQAPAFMIQRADDDPVDAWRIVGSPGHGGWVRLPRISPGCSMLYNAIDGGIAGPVSGLPKVKAEYSFLPLGTAHLCSVSRTE